MPSLNTGNAILSNPIKVDSSYNVGIGTSTPLGKLHVSSPTDVSAYIVSSGGDYNTNLYLGYGSVYTQTYIKREASNLVFGTTNVNRLTIASTGAATFSSSVTNKVTNISADGAGVVLQGYVDNALRIAVRGSGYNDGVRGGLYASFGDFNSSITTGGDITIPNGNYYYSKRNTGNSNINILGFPSGSDTLTLRGGTSGAAVAMQFQDTGGTVMSLYNSNVGIGINNPEFSLHAYQNGVNTFVAGTSTITDNGQQCGVVARATYSGVNRGSTHAMYKHTGISLPATYVSFYSGNSGFGYLYIDDSNILRISNTSGDIGLAAGTVIGTQTSDIRLKNVKESFNYGLNDILKINPIAFTFKNDKENIDRLGFSAQEMLNIIPESVYDTNNCIDGYDETDDEMIKIPKSNDNIYGMDYTTIIPVLVKAIQELNQTIQNQQQQINSLINR